MIITYEQICALEPCGYRDEDDGKNYTPQRIRTLMGGRESITLQEVHDRPDVPWRDKYWLFCKALPDSILLELACRVAETCEIVDADLRARRDALIATKRAWVRGEIGDNALAADRAADRAAAYKRFCGIALELAQEQINDL